MNPPAVPRPPGVGPAIRHFTSPSTGGPAPAGVGGLPGRSPFHRLVRPLVRDAALHLDHGGGPDVDRVPRAGPGGGRRRCGVRDTCDGVERPASAPFPPPLLTHPM